MKRNIDEKYGIEGEFYIDGGGSYGQDHEDNIIDYNYPPSTQPGLWCKWVPSNDRKAIEWDEGEKFYDYREWIVYIIKNFLKPNGYILNRVVSYEGEDLSDNGQLIIIDNVLQGV